MIIKAAMTPGTQPQNHNIVVMIIDPHPLSNTAKGGHKIESNTLQILIVVLILIDVPIGRKFQANVTVDEIDMTRGESLNLNTYI